MKLTKEEALRIIASKGTVDSPGIWRAKCTNVTPYPADRGNGVKQVAIANFNLKSAYHKRNAVALLVQGQFDDAANQGLSLSILEGQAAPMKDQIVDVVVEEVTLKDGTVGLFARSFTVAPVQQPVKDSIEELEALANGQIEEGVSIMKEEVIETEAPFKA